MFKKAQLKLFAIITSILIAVFVAMLSSINIITEAVMQKQSQQVLKQIAEGVEYDDSTSTFTYTDPNGMDHHKDDHGGEEPPSKPEGEPGNDETRPSQEATTQPDTTDVTEPSSEKDKEGETTLPATVPPAQNTEAHQPQTSAGTASGTAAPSTEGQTEQQQQQTQQPQTTAKPTQQPVVTTAAPTTQAPAQTTQVTTVPPKPGEGNEDPWHRDPWEQDGDQQYPNPDPFSDWGRWYYDTDASVGSSGEEDDDDDEYEETDGEEYEITDEYGGNFVIDQTDDQEEAGSIVLLANTETTTQKPTEKYGGGQNGGQGGAQDNGQNGGQDGAQGNGQNGGQSGAQNGGDPQSGEIRIEPVPKTLGSIDFFVIMADKQGNYLATLNNDDITEETAQKYITAILDDGAQTGMVNHIYQFYRQPKENGTLMVFTDKSAEMDTLDQFNRTTIIIGAISVIVLSIAAYFLSKKSIQPIKIAFERQKQFVSDASHELKTPLTVISANADVLAGEIGENKWLNYIKSQTDRMNVLVNDLLNLTRLENNTTDFICVDFDLSKAAENTALPFECQAFEMNRNFEVDIEEGLTINGSERHVKQMMAIFIDNALKYSNEGGTVKVSLIKHGDKKVFSVFNTGEGVKESEKDKIFERFYRSDESRNRATGGYGLGLAIAKSIIDKHKFKVHVENQEGRSICFVVTM